MKFQTKYTRRQPRLSGRQGKRGCEAVKESRPQAKGPTPPARRFRYRMDTRLPAAFFGYRAMRLSSKCNSFQGAVGTGLRPVLGRSETCPTKRMCWLNTSRPMRQDADTRMSMFSRNRFLYSFIAAFLDHRRTRLSPRV